MRLVIIVVLGVCGILFGKYVLEIEDHGFLMAYGYAMYTIVFLIADAVTE